jgi:hypothetical protein
MQFFRAFSGLKEIGYQALKRDKVLIAEKALRASARFLSKFF